MGYLFEGVKTEAAIRLSQSTPKKAFPAKQLNQIVEAVLFADQNFFPDLLLALRTVFLEPFTDLRYYVLPAIESAVALLRRTATNRVVVPENLSHRVFLLLNILPIPPEVEKGEFGKEHWTPDGISRRKSEDPKAYKAAFVSVWTKYLQLDSDELHLSPAVYKEILTVIPMRVLPSMTAPLKLAKFFLSGFHGNDVAVAVQALSGLFYLLVKGRLGEPQLIDEEGQNFYHRLLSLLQPKVFSLPVRVRFLRLMRLSLQSKLLSTEMRAAFIKKLVAGKKFFSIDVFVFFVINSMILFYQFQF